MNKDTAIDFYNEIKNTFDDEIFNEFYEYFELTWLNPDINIKTKFEFSLWSYHGKFDFKNQRKKYLISDEALDNSIFVSNNTCESLNNLNNNYIEINSKVSLSKFETILKALFIRKESNRVNTNQRAEKIINKRSVSDNLLSLINLGVGLKKKLFTANDLKKIKESNKEENLPRLNLIENKEDDLVESDSGNERE